MKLSKRLEKIATYTSGYNSLADIACDHGYLGIYAYLTYGITDILLSDINPEPLESAKSNIIKYHTPGIKIKLGDGLKSLDKDYECISISGIGGFLMRDILASGLDRAKKAKRLILCPNSDSYEVRKFLTLNGFEIDNETMVFDYKYYEIMTAKYTEKNSCYNELELLYGPFLLKEKSAEFKAFYSKQLLLAKKHLESVKDKAASEKLQNKIKELEYVLKASD